MRKVRKAKKTAGAQHSKICDPLHKYIGEIRVTTEKNTTPPRHPSGHWQTTSLESKALAWVWTRAHTFGPPPFRYFRLPSFGLPSLGSVSPSPLCLARSLDRPRRQQLEKRPPVCLSCLVPSSPRIFLSIRWSLDKSDARQVIPSQQSTAKTS